jgi:DNA (cytosine-5)-methyltransferase 1
MPMRIGELFAGIGGLGLGLEWSGLGPVVWQVEQDEYARRVLAKHWPEARRYDDVRSVEANQLVDAELWAAGFPCQDLSLSGRMQGLEGERSGLFWHIIRLVRGALELGHQPILLLENVSALLSADGGGAMGNVLGALASCGYDAEWQSFPSGASVGAPHLRDRTFIVAYPNSSRLAIGQGVFANLREELEAIERNNRGPGGWFTSFPGVSRVDDGLPHRTHRTICIGNAVVPFASQAIGACIQRRLACQSTR